MNFYKITVETFIYCTLLIYTGNLHIELTPKKIFGDLMVMYVLNLYLYYSNKEEKKDHND